MPATRATVFVLWGVDFDETIAVLFVTMLREAGLRVKMVGLDGLCAKGAHGLGLLADLTLDQALSLADQALCVVIPCTMQRLQRVRDDPRVEKLLAQTHQAEILLVSTIQSER
jgi:hypothetical protein